VLSEHQSFVARLASTPWPEADVRGSTSQSHTIFLKLCILQLASDGMERLIGANKSKTRLAKLERQVSRKRGGRLERRVLWVRREY
jgi:hypothetical protein